MEVAQRWVHSDYKAGSTFLVSVTTHHHNSDHRPRPLISPGHQHLSSQSRRTRNTRRRSTLTISKAALACPPSLPAFPLPTPYRAVSPNLILVTMSDTASTASFSSLSSADRQRAYGILLNVATQRNFYIGLDVAPADRKHNTKWLASITVNGFTYRSDAYTAGKMEALHLAAGKALRDLGLY